MEFVFRLHPVNEIKIKIENYETGNNNKISKKVNQNQQGQSNLNCIYFNVFWHFGKCTKLP